ncbi:MAG: M24 family metallopeptidase, partial [Acidobacteria bacterium]|nr:M24 family metallopeptidase [Acidobacteriota bacterium]
MTIESEHQLDALKRICQIVATILKKMLERVEPGLTTLALDQYGQELFDYYGARSAPRLTYNFPGTTCISINEEAAHGIPGARVIQPGDLVNIDVSGELNGFFGDTGG